jgi:hypothetical protein
MPSSKLFLFTALLAIVLSSLLSSQPTNKDTDWKQWYFLLGEWVGEGSRTQGQGTGSFSFEMDLQKRILVRKNTANYPATKDQAGYTHSDLMIIYKQPPNSTRAIYFDNEGHIINYIVNIPDDQNSVTFLSVGEKNTPLYRLNYVKVNNEKLKIKFEIAQPDKPDKFSTYIEATAHRK